MTYLKSRDYLGNRKCMRCGGVLDVALRCAWQGCSNSEQGIVRARSVEWRACYTLVVPSAPRLTVERNTYVADRDAYSAAVPPGWREVDPGVCYERAWMHESSARVMQFGETGVGFVFAAARSNIDVNDFALSMLQAMARALGYDIDQVNMVDERRAFWMWSSRDLRYQMRGYETADEAARDACDRHAGIVASENAAGPLPPRIVTGYMFDYLSNGLRFTVIEYDRGEKVRLPGIHSNVHVGDAEPEGGH